MFIGHFGAALAARRVAPRDRIGRLGFAALVGFLVLVHAANAFGPPPPSARAVAVAALSIWLLVLWAGWVDRHRVAATGARRG